MRFLYLSTLAAGLALASASASADGPFCSTRTLLGSYFTASDGFNGADLDYAPMGFAAVAYYDGNGHTDFTAVNVDNSEVTLKGTYVVDDHCRGEVSYSVGDDIRTVTVFVAPAGDELYFVETGGPEISHKEQGRILAGVGHRVSLDNLVGIDPN